MSLGKRYDPAEVEPRLAAWWQENGVNGFDLDREGPVVYSIDTPPPTVSGFLHLGHVYSYSHPDFIARFRRMCGDNVFFPMGFDDNGLPTERLVERRLGQTPEELGRSAFIQACLEASAELELEYEALWRRLGLSIDWRYTYSTINDLSRRTSQSSFLDLYRKGLAYRRRAPSIWCPHCHTAIAQAEVNDVERQSEFLTLPFRLHNGDTLEVATTRPELLPACVAVFVHPDDARFRELVDRQATVPLFGQSVPVLHDDRADPSKGTGAVMCCTFGDQMDVEWWYTHDLPLRDGLDRHGRLTPIAGVFGGESVAEARQSIGRALEEEHMLLERRPVSQTVRVHDRCDTTVEYIVMPQWFIPVLDHKEALLAAGEEVKWYPAHMQARYREWVTNLHWDWCISRQRLYGVAFPVWYCTACGEIMVAEEDALPVDPTEQTPPQACACGSASFEPERDVMDTWATSSVSPQIAGRLLADPALYARVFPFSLRAQAHDIIRTWAFDTIVKSQYHFGQTPWRAVLISGWGLAAEGAGKISKSRGGGPMPPMEMVAKYSADAARYWAASTGLGKDATISEEKIQVGAKLVTKLWNVARFAERFLAGFQIPPEPPPLSAADRWILSCSQRLIQQATGSFTAYDYMGAKNATERFFWGDLCNNYLEMAKKRLYDDSNALHAGARFTLHHTLLMVLKLFAPILPYVTEEIYQGLFAVQESIHRSSWPVVDTTRIDERAETAGQQLLQVASAVRQYKSEQGVSLSTPLARLQLTVQPDGLLDAMADAADDVSSVTRAAEVVISGQAEGEMDGMVHLPTPQSELVISVMPLEA